MEGTWAVDYYGINDPWPNKPLFKTSTRVEFTGEHAEKFAREYWVWVNRPTKEGGILMANLIGPDGGTVVMVTR